MQLLIPKINLKNPIILLFAALLALGLYLRFWQIEKKYEFTWDQGRDAWAVKDIIDGKFPLKGPRTGIGDFYLGPAYYYLISPFYFAAGMDPMGANYFNITVNIATFVTLFLVTRKIFGVRMAAIALTIYALGFHTVQSTKVPWNVSMIPLLVTLIFFCFYQILEGKYRYFLLLAAVTGFFFHIHFTAVFVPPMMLLLGPFIKTRKKAFLWAVYSLPLFIIWFAPTIIDSVTTYNDNYYRFRNFLKDYAMGFHFRFMLYRLPDSLIQFTGIMYFRILEPIKYLLLPILVLTIFLREKSQNKVKLTALFLVWFLVPLFGFSLFKGHVTDYYYLINLPIAVLIISYLIDKLLGLKKPALTLIIFLALGVYFWQNITKTVSEKPRGGLYKQKQEVKNLINSGGKLEYKEGDIKPYLYTIWTSGKSKQNGKM